MTRSDGGFEQPMVAEFYPPTDLITDEVRLRQGDYFRVEDLEGQIMTSRNGFLWSKNFAQETHLDRYLLKSSHFTTREDWAVGRTDSAQGVYFGVLDLTIDNGREISVPVAAKPYSSMERERAVHEYAALKHFGDTESITTFEPVGMWVDEVGAATLLTKFEPSVVSLDNYDWNRTEDDTLKDHFDLFFGLGVAAQLLGRYHIGGFGHKDAQHKNLAVDTETGTVRAIDLTTLRLNYTPERPSELAWRSGVFDDLTTFVGSILRRGYLDGTEPDEVRNIVDTQLLSRHAAMLRHPSSPLGLDHERVEETIIDIRDDVLSQI